MIDWCVTAWRQQSSQRDQILTWLAEARRLGFEQYGLVKQGNHYWLCCCNYAKSDLAIHVRDHVRLSKAVFVQLEGNQLICVAWNGDTLLGASQFNADALGIKSLTTIAKHWFSTDGMSCPLVFGGAHSRQILETVISADIIVKDMPEIDFSSCSRRARLRSIRRSPIWLRRRVIIIAMIFALISAVITSWVYWPAQVKVATAPKPTIVKPVEHLRPHWSPSHLRHLNDLLASVSYLAGWQVQRWQLSEFGEELWLQSTYGSQQDLFAQLPNAADWRLRRSGNAVYVERELPTVQSQALSSNAVAVNLEQFDFVITRSESGLKIEHAAFDPTDANQWDALLNWLIQHADSTQLVSAEAEASGYFWSLSLQLEQISQGARL
jgi:hypothetical protein